MALGGSILAWIQQTRTVLASPWSQLVENDGKRNDWMSIDGEIDITAHALFIMSQTVEYKQRSKSVVMT